MRSQAGKHQFPEESESCSKIVSSFCLHSQSGCSNCNDIFIWGFTLFSWIRCQNHATVQAWTWPVKSSFPSIPPGISLANIRDPGRKMFLDLVAAYHSPPSYLQPFSPQPPPPSHSPKGKSSFPDFLSVRDSQGKGPSRCSWKSTSIVEGRRKMRELG